MILTDGLNGILNTTMVEDIQMMIGRLVDGKTSVEGMVDGGRGSIR